MNSGAFSVHGDGCQYDCEAPMLSAPILPRPEDLAQIALQPLHDLIEPSKRDALPAVLQTEQGRGRQSRLS